MALKTTPWDSAEYLKSEADISAYLDACFEEAGDDPAFLVHALGVAARVEPFIADMGAAYARADLVVARAGAMSCAEVTARGLPAVLVPYPHAADDHQRRNAEVLATAGAAELILDHELTGERLAAALRPLVSEPTHRAAMAARSRALGRPDAAERVAGACIGLLARA